MRLFAIVVFAFAVTGATLAGSGLVVAAYRLPIFLATMQARFDPGRGILTEHLSDAATVAFVLALLTFAWPRLPRPTRRSVAELALQGVAQAQWRPVLILGPPRG
jgi:hypothetical protein